ncbi:15-hydroxyprostaglandin dehydrogenase [NAD(+)]-like [Antennarius striatus]|uniref:15-hydroxyprostaglandin dehydrogenase [NAD(+)]-like n=1 Tax=Antennarius striatus TaxID=241820 RepID=UPI0035B127BC
MALTGKVAAVTGAAMGIGRAMTELLLQHGAKVALLDVNETAAKSLMEVLAKQFGPERVLFVRCDVESEEQFRDSLQKTVDTFGGIDIMCNNAGILNEALLEKTVSINLVAVIRGTYLATELMRKLNGDRGGVIINTASITGIFPLMSIPIYTSTKHGVIGFTRSTAAAFAALGYGIRVNALCPTFVQTELFSDIPSRLGQFSKLDEHNQQLLAQLGLLSVSETVEPILELITDITKNGEAICVSPKGKKYATFPTLMELLT